MLLLIVRRRSARSVSAPAAVGAWGARVQHHAQALPDVQVFKTSRTSAQSRDDPGKSLTRARIGPYCV